MNEKRQGAAPRLAGRWRVLLRSSWLLISLVAVGLYSADFPIRYARLLDFFQEEGRTVLLLGRSPSFYAAYLMGLDLATALAYGTTALVIFWRRADDSAVLITSLSLVTFGVAITPATDLLQTSSLEWRATFAPLQTAGRGLSLLALYTFPDGRFVLGWPRVVSVLYGLWLLFSLCFPAAPFSWYSLSTPLFLAVFIVPFASAVWVQLYRYRHHASPVEQQQTKWVVFGSAAAVVGRILFTVFHRLAPTLGLPNLVQAVWLLVSVHLLWGGLLTLPLSFGVAVLRYHLWEIDLIIRRTLLYTTVTAALALLYFGSVFLWQTFFRAMTAQDTQLATVLSTLVIAALFTPLRHRIQQGIDRRFYRHHYDREQIIAAASAASRNEVELNKLLQTQIAIIQDSLQPVHVSFWLSPTPGGIQKQASVRAERTNGGTVAHTQ